MKAELIDVMGDDLRVVNAARVSFDKESEWEEDFVPAMCPREDGTCCGRGPGDCPDDYHYKELSEKDQKLLNYLAKHNHWTPFSHVMVTMRETVPLFVRAQRMKHFVGFNLSGENDHEGLGMTYNEVSRRYVDESPEFFYPDEWRGKPVNAKQGSSDVVMDELTIRWGHDDYNYQQVIELCTEYYEQMIKAGFAPEQARMVLPQSMMTSYYVTGSLAAWARAYKLRFDAHSQKEIQDLAKQWGDIFDSIPSLQHSWAALTA